MTFEYKYSISTNFTNATNVNITQLQGEIDGDVTISVNVTHINMAGDNVSIYFQQSLDGEQTTALNSLITAYTYTPLTSESISPAFQTVVSNVVGEGDYTSISAAFNAGATSVFVKQGTHIETNDINIPDGGRLFGEINGKTVIFLAAGNSIIIDGSGGDYESTGTISVTNTTTTVTGVGTTFSNLSPEEFISLGTNYYPIASIESDTSLTLTDMYRGKTLTDVSYQAQAMYTGCTISDIIITGSSTVGLYIRALRHGGINTVALLNCAPCVQIIDSSDLSLRDSVISYSTGIGISILNSMSISMHTLNVFNCTSHGLECGGLNIIQESSASENNTGEGFRILADSTYMNINDCVFKNNAAGGISGVASTLYTTITNSDISDNGGKALNIVGTYNKLCNNFIINNTDVGITSGECSIIESNTIINCSGNGINIPTGSDKCIIGDNCLTNNAIHINVNANLCSIDNNTISNSTGDGIYVSGVKNRIQSNTVIDSGAKGIQILGNNNIASSNIVETSVGTGLEIITGSVNTIVTSNNLLGNTGTNYVDNGTTTVASNNITV